MTKATFIKDSTWGWFYLGLVYRFRGSVHYHHGRKHGRIQTYMVLEETRVLHLHRKEARNKLSPTWLGGRSQNPPPQWHTFSNKATPPNSAIPLGPSIQTHESMETKPIQTTTPWFHLHLASISTIWKIPSKVTLDPFKLTININLVIIISIDFML